MKNIIAFICSLLIWNDALAVSPASPASEMPAYTNPASGGVMISGGATGNPTGISSGGNGHYLCDSGSGWQSCTGGSNFTPPASGQVIVSNGTQSPGGVAPVNGQYLCGSGGAWTTCAGTSGSVSLGTSVAPNPNDSSATTDGLYASGGNTVGIAIGGTAVVAVTSGGQAITASGINSFAVGPSGTTNPVFNVDSSTASAVAGIDIVGAATGGTVVLKTTDSGSNNNIDVEAKGTGTATLAGTSTGGITIGNTSSAGTTITAISTGTITQRINATNVEQVKQSAVVFAPGTSPTGSNIYFQFTMPATSSAMTASTNGIYGMFGTSGGVTRLHNTGAQSLQSDWVFQPTTDSYVGASTLTNGATLEVFMKSCGTNGTCTNESGIYIPSQALSGTVTNGYGLNVAAPTGAGTLNQAALFTGDTAITSGNLILNTAGNGIQIKSGSNARIGTGTLSGGTLTVSNTSVTANTLVFLTDTTSGSLTNVGSLTVTTSAGTGFTVTSTNPLDTSTFNWVLIEKS